MKDSIHLALKSKKIGSFREEGIIYPENQKNIFTPLRLQEKQKNKEEKGPRSKDKRVLLKHSLEMCIALKNALRATNRMSHTNIFPNIIAENSKVAGALKAIQVNLTETLNSLIQSCHELNEELTLKNDLVIKKY